MKETSFLKSLSAISGVLDGQDAISLVHSETPQTEDTVEKINTACRACISNCSVIATVKNGRVVYLEGNPIDPMSRGRMCAKGLAGIQSLYNPNRNKYPMLRVGERGENKWKRITWEEAFDLIAHKLLEVKEKYGAESVFCSTGGGGNPEFWSPARFCNIFGTPNWFEPGCAQCYLPRLAIYALMYGGTDPSIADSHAYEIYFDDSPINCAVLWGTDPSYSCTAMGGATINNMRARGVKTVVIDPRMTPDAAKATVWLPIRPGTDVALALSWIRYIIDQNLYDKDFVMKWTNLPFLVDPETGMFLRAGDPDKNGMEVFTIWDKKTNSSKPLEYPWNDDYDVELDGEYEINGKKYKTAFRLLKERVEEWTLEKAADVCGLMPEKIEEAIKIYCEGPSGIGIGVATDQSPNSAQAPQATCIIEGLMGNVERPGALLNRFGESGVFTLGHIVPPALTKISQEQFNKKIGTVDHKGLHMWAAGHAPSILQTLETGEPYPLKMWLERSGNKFVNLADGQRWEKAIENVDFIVHMYMYPTSFSMYADLLLPAQEWLEHDVPQECLNFLLARQHTTHLWETMNEAVIWSRIVKRCAELGDEDCKKAFDEEYMGADMPNWSNMPELLDKTMSKIGKTWDEFRQMTPYPYMPEEEYRQYYKYTKEDPNTGKPAGFNTRSKKMELYAECLLELGRTGMPFAQYPMAPASKDYDPLPYYIEPYESLRGEGANDEYPLLATNGRLPLFHHGTLRNNAVTRELCPVPEVWLHPDAAEKYGIEDNQWIWVESERGRTRGVSHVTTGINPDTVYMERFWAPENLHKDTHGWKEMNISMLARSKPPYGDVFGTYTLRAFAVKVYPAPEGAPEGVWLDAKEFKPWLATASDPTPDMTLEG